MNVEGNKKKGNPKNSDMAGEKNGKEVNKDLTVDRKT